jgi:hypothetical protein
MGLGFGATAGYLGVEQSNTGEGLRIAPVGFDPRDVEAGTIDNLSRMRGVLMGAWLGYTWGERAFLHLRLGAGALVGSMLYEYTNGSFPDIRGGTYSVGPLIQRHPFTYFYLTPEARVGLSLGRHAAIFAGIGVPVFLRVGQAVTWDSSQYYSAGGAGIATLPPIELMQAAWVAIAPGIGARYDF